MPKRLVRRGRVRGYRPTHSQLQEILELAQRDFGDASAAHLVYSQGDLEIYPQADTPKILPNHIDEIIKEADDPDELNNLDFSISQATPIRRVETHIGPGNWTTYRVESDDQTWAYGRYHELTDKLMSNRSLYAKFKSGTPQVLKEGTDDRWRSTPWEPPKNWLVFATGIATILPWMLLVLAAFAAIILAVQAANPGSNATERESHRIALQDAHYLGAHAPILAILILCYIITLFAYQHWLRTWLRSKIVLRKPSLISQFSFRGRKSDTVSLASFYVAVFTLIATSIALIIQ